MDSTVEFYQSGVQNFYPNEDIADDASQDALGFLTKDGRQVLVGGRIALGSEGAVGQIRGLWYGYRVDGVQVLYRKIETKLQYWDGSAWQDVITGLTSGSEGSFANYASLSGAFTFFVNVDGYWKMNNANPTTPIKLYDNTSLYRGRILIDKGRTILWAKVNDPTGLLLSRIDSQNSTVYTTVACEVLSCYFGTLAFKSGDTKANAFGVTITLNSNCEVYTDNYNGVLTGNMGGTGTINYASGAYAVSVSSTGKANYQWEDSTNKGLADFTFSATRLAGEAITLRQDQGGDPIMKVLIGQDGNYYSIKQQSVYQLILGVDDLSFSNLVYYSNMGMPSNNATVSTKDGILFLNNSNPLKPELTLLQKNPIGDNILPIVYCPQFKFSLFDFSDSYFDTYERYIIISCKQSGSTDNDRILLVNLSEVKGGSVDISPYNARMFAKDSSDNLYAGSSVAQTVDNIFNGFDDKTLPIQSYWTSKAQKYIIKGLRAMKWRFIGETLKKFRRLRMKGYISPDQSVEVYISFDDAGFQLMGTILGNGTYVDYNNPQAIGDNFIGESAIGGDKINPIYPYFWEMKMYHCPKFRKRTIQIIPTGIGYFDFNFSSDWDIELFESRIPKRFRMKQKVSLAGIDNQV